MKKFNVTKFLISMIKYAFLLALCVAFLLPLISVFFSAFKTNPEMAQSLSNGEILNAPKSFFNFDNFKVAFVDGHMLTGIKNTTIILFFSLIITVLNGTTVAYILVRFDNRFNGVVNALFTGAVMIPNVIAQIALFQIITKMGLFDNLLAPILLYGGTDVMSIYIFIQFLRNISVSLDEAAIVDGCSYLQVYGKIILPLLKPAIVTVAITKGVNIYNDFYIPFLYIPSQDHLTISTVLFKFKGPYGARWEVICAGVILFMIPTLVAFLTLQKSIYSGMVAGSVKE